jgi:hypothetical protein
LPAAQRQARRRRVLAGVRDAVVRSGSPVRSLGACPRLETSLPLLLRHPRDRGPKHDESRKVGHGITLSEDAA